MKGIDGTLPSNGALNPNIQYAIPALTFQQTAAPVECARIRILHVMGHLLRGGIENWLYQMIQRLDPLHFTHHILVRTADEEPFTQSFRQAGVRVIPCLHFKNPLRFAWNFARLVRRNGPYEIVHVHGSSLSGLLCLLLSKPLGIKTVVVHSHNDINPLLQSSSPHYRLYCRMVGFFYRKLPHFGFACSQRAAVSMFGKHWESDPRFRLLYYGIDFAPFAAAPDQDLRNRLGIPRGAFVVGHVGRFHEQKNHAFLLSAASAAVRRAPNLHFLLIGDGPLRAQITGEIERLGLRSRFTIVSDTASVAGYMTGAMDCFILPSRYEGLGLVAVEAQAAALPCLLSDRVPCEAIVDPSLVQVLPLDNSANGSANPSAARLWAAALLRLRRAAPRQKAPGHLEKFRASRFNADVCAASLAAFYKQISGREDLEPA
jgi:glycosyltransferase involved in cell wall biosynthesis